MDSILDIIREIQQQGKTGSLQLIKGDKSIILCFRNGLIDGAGSGIAELRLGSILSQKGILKTSGIPQLLEKARRKRMILGEAAVYARLMDDADLKESIFDQIVLTLDYAITNDFSIGDFDENSIDLYMPARIDVDTIALELARRNLTPVQLDRNGLLSLNNGHDLSQYPWYPQELSVLSMLNTPCSLNGLAASTGIEYARLNKILSVFLSLNLLKQVESYPGESTAVIKRDESSFEKLIPEIGTVRLSSRLETYHNPTSFISEQFKTLKVRLSEASAQAPLRVIAVSSPHSEDGKSLISANLAISLSKDQGKRVVVVDCDLRNPSLHKFLGASVEPGLVGYLEEEHLQSYCYLRRLEKLYVMTAGGISQNPVELLSNARMEELLAELKKDFDTVILDCPPFGPISDAQILTGLADGFLMVMRCGKTTYATIDKAFKTLDRSKLIGLIFNDVKPMMFNTRYHYKYYHYRSRGNYPYGAIRITRRRKTYLE